MVDDRESIYSNYSTKPFVGEPIRMNSSPSPAKKITSSEEQTRTSSPNEKKSVG